MNIRGQTAPPMLTFCAKMSIPPVPLGRPCLLAQIAAVRVRRRDAVPAFSASTLSPVASNTVAHTIRVQLCTTVQVLSPSLGLRSSPLPLLGLLSRTARAAVVLLPWMEMGCAGFTRRCAQELLRALLRIAQPHAPSWANAISPLALDRVPHRAAMPLQPTRLAWLTVPPASLSTALS